MAGGRSAGPCRCPMIEIRPDQMAVFESRDRAAFTGRALAYLREAHRAALRDLADEELRAKIERHTASARSYGITAEAGVVQFIEIALAFGDDFHSSWRYPAAERILTSSRNEAEKIRELVSAARQEFSEAP